MAGAGGSWKAGAFTPAAGGAQTVLGRKGNDVLSTTPLATSRTQLQDLYPQLVFMRPERRRAGRVDVSIDMQRSRAKLGDAGDMLPQEFTGYFGTGKTADAAYRSLDIKLRGYYKPMTFKD